MKKILKYSFLFIALLSTTLTGCKKDEEKLNEYGLIEDIPGINPDAIFVKDGKELIVEDSIATNDYTTPYELELIGFENEDVVIGSIIIDFRNTGRIWIITEIKPGKSNTSYLVSALQGSLSVLFHNVVLEFATPTNRTKDASTYENKLASEILKVYSNNEQIFNVTPQTISIEDIATEDGINISLTRCAFRNKKSKSCPE